MATSVIFAASSFGATQFSPASHALAISSNLTVDATVQNVTATSSGAGDMISGTLAATPTLNDVLIAVIMRADGQAVTTGPAGWTLLTAGATSGSRSLEVWWYRSTGVVGDKGPHTFLRGAGTANWCIELYGFSGTAVCGNPTVGTASASFTSDVAVTRTAAMDSASSKSPGAVLTAFVVGGGTISGIGGAFSGTGTQEAHATYINGTFTRGGASTVDIYNNVDFTTSPTYGTAWTWTTSRAGHSCAIHLNGGGVANIATAASIGAGIGNTGFTNSLSQAYMTFDTSSIPDANTISSAVLDITGAGSVGGANFADPSVAVLQARYHGTTAPTNTRGNNDNHWLLSASAFAAKTLVATYPAGSAWSPSAANTLTSQTALATNVNKTGNTVLVYSTDEYATATAGSGTQAYAIANPTTGSTLTVVHSFVGTATVAASATATPTISRVANLLRTIAAAADASPTLSRIPSFARTIAASVDASPTLSRIPSFARTIAASVAAVPAIVANYQPFSAQLPRILRLAGRSTVTLVTQSTLRLLGRSTLKLPKE
jgi:hypothetical protein